MLVTLRSTTLLGKYSLAYGYHILGDKADHIEYLCDEDLPSFEQIAYDQRKHIKIIVLGRGKHHIPYVYNDTQYTLIMDVKEDKYDETIYSERNLNILSIIELSLDSNISNNHVNHHDVLLRFVDDAKKHVDNVMKQYMHDTKRIKRYIFNEKYDEWEVLNVSPTRKFNTIFLKREEKQKLVTFVTDFVDADVRAEYRRYSVPYKANILLYGDPGTGKSSSILAIATEIKSDIAIIQFTSTMNDTKVFKAINSLSNMERCKIVVMEDIDSLFMNRMQHDTSKCAITMSGLLNAMDGLSRVEGIIVVMTTNHIECLDHALLRPCRIDLMIKFTFATEDQVQEMFKAYFPEHMQDILPKFNEKIKFKSISTSMLQQYFFMNRKTPTKLLENISTLFELAKEKGAKCFKSDEQSDSMYK